jgi:hypothetical protein
MKARFLSFGLIFATFALSAVFMISGCQKSVGPFDPSTATYQYSFKGQVVDAVTNSGIPSATVKVFNKVYTTDVNGYFTFRVSYATEFPFEVKAEAADYLVGNSLISGPTQVRAIRLTAKNPAVILNETGGSIVAPSHESLTGKSFEVTFPAGALSGSVAVSLTPMEEFYFMYGEVINLQKSTTDLLDLATVSLSPLELTLQKPVTLYVPLPFANDKDSRFPVMKFNPVTSTWSYTGKDLVVDGTLTGGTVELSQGGIYSVAGQGTYTEEKISESFLNDFSCQASGPYIWQAGIEHPAGVPPTISAIWLKNTVSHNTVIGGHVSFLRETSTNVVCESYQPGSSYPVPSDEIQMPLIPQCPSGTNPILVDDGVSIHKRIINGMLTINVISNGSPEPVSVPDIATVNVAIHAYTWKCLHDQGGGK